MAATGKRGFPWEFAWQLGSLLFAFLLIHSLYVLVVWPRADAILAEQAAMMAVDPGYVQERSLWVIVRDYEQEACFVLMLWAFALMGSRGYAVGRERHLLEQDLLPLEEGTRILPEDAREYARHLEGLPHAAPRRVLVGSLLAGLRRFGATRSIQDASSTAHDVCEGEAQRLESELSMVRYLAWAIPSIGFLGTVRGIGQALGQAHMAVEGEIAGVTRSLGTAFNSTFVALLISILVMFLLHQLQLRQERLILDVESYVDDHMVNRLQGGGSAQDQT